MESQYKRMTDSQWAIIKEVLPVERKRKYNLRVMVDAIFWVLRLGSQWRNLPEELFPKWQLVYYYFRKWQADGTLEKLNWQLNRQARKRQGKAAPPSLMCIDSQSIKVAPFVCEQTGTDGNPEQMITKRYMGVSGTLSLIR